MDSLRLLFSYNGKLGSKLIRAGSWAFDDSNLKYADIPSHTAILLNGFWVVESVMSSGVRVIPYYRWLKINTEVASIPISHYKENPRELINEIWGKKYDFIALLWFIKAVFCAKVCKLQKPVTNQYESEDKFFCVELVGRCLGIANYGTITPAELLVYILKPENDF